MWHKFMHQGKVKMFQSGCPTEGLSRDICTSSCDISPTGAALVVIATLLLKFWVFELRSCTTSLTIRINQMSYQSMSSSLRLDALSDRNSQLRTTRKVYTLASLFPYHFIVQFSFLVVDDIIAWIRARWGYPWLRRIKPTRPDQTRPVPMLGLSWQKLRKNNENNINLSGAEKMKYQKPKYPT